MQPNGRLRLTIGEVNSTLARVYLRYQGADAAGLTLRGMVRGPHCRYARTLPASAPFALRSGVGHLVAEALLPDPCFWTPDEPHLYEVSAELVRDDVVVESIQHRLGIRRLVTRKTDLVWEGRRTVIRAAYVAGPTETDLSTARDLGLALVVSAPDDAACAAASDVGVLLIADVSNSADALDQYHRLARHASVGVVVFGDPASLPGTPGETLRGFSVAAGAVSVPDCDVVLTHDWTSNATLLEESQFPVLVAGDQKSTESFAELRAACDTLQRQMAPLGQFAGYVV